MTNLTGCQSVVPTIGRSLMLSTRDQPLDLTSFVKTSKNALAHFCALLLLSQPVTQICCPRSGEPGPTTHRVEAELSEFSKARLLFSRVPLAAAPIGPLIWMAGAEVLVRSMFVSKSTVKKPSLSPSCLNAELANARGGFEAKVTRAIL